MLLSMIRFVFECFPPENLNLKFLLMWRYMLSVIFLIIRDTIKVLNYWANQIPFVSFFVKLIAKIALSIIVLFIATQNIIILKK